MAGDVEEAIKQGCKENALQLALGQETRPPLFLLGKLGNTDVKVWIGVKRKWGRAVMAEILGMEPKSLGRWISRLAGRPKTKAKRGRPEVIGLEAGEKLRACYLAHYKQWGPAVLAWWAKREGLGIFSPGAIDRVIRDLKDPPPEEEVLFSYEIKHPLVMWSEDGS